MKKILAVSSVIAIVFVVAFIFINSSTPNPNQSDENFPSSTVLGLNSWESAKSEILACNVMQLTQTHNLEVELKLKNGSTIKAKEPVIDEVINLANSVKDKCGQLPLIATE